MFIKLGQAYYNTDLIICFEKSGYTLQLDFGSKVINIMDQTGELLKLLINTLSNNSRMMH